MNDAVMIGKTAVGPNSPPYVVAEISANHLGDLDRALTMIDVAHECGANAVKLQTYTADTMTIDADTPDFKISEGLWAGRSLYELYGEASMPWEWHEALFARGREIGISVFSTPFDPTSVAFLERFDPVAYKIASFEAVDLALIRRVAATGRPLVISTGMANRTEIEEAVGAARDSGCKNLILLHCISGYPTPVSESNLRTLEDLSRWSGCVVGLSDHTLQITAALGAVALGAAMIEKHFTLARADGGPDAAFSLEPAELKELCSGVREVWKALGNVTYERQPSEQQSMIFRRSIYVVRDIAEGELFSEENIQTIRPGFGLAPKHFHEVVGCEAVGNIPRGAALQWAHIKGKN